MEPIPPHWHEHLLRLGAGVAGSIVSFRFVGGKTRSEKLLTALGGVSLSYFATNLVAAKLGIPDDKGLVGFLLGLFGMALLAKAYEMVEAMDAGGYAALLQAAVKRITGVTPGKKKP